MVDRTARIAPEQSEPASGAHRGHPFKTGLGLLLLLALPSAGMSAQGASLNRKAPAKAQPHGRTIGLALTDFKYAFYQTQDGKEECPAGLQASEVDQYKAMPDAKEHLARFGGSPMNRGPNGEFPAYSPMAVTDPISWKEVATDKSVGFNLDGTADGKATPKTCTHRKLVAPSGEHIDNQMARAIGCIQSWRHTGSTESRYSKDVESSVYNRVLIEISGVDDEKNDPDVEINFYKSRDRILRDASGNFVPFMTHRVDTLFPEFMAKGHGRIVDGVLISDPVSLVRMPVMMIQVPGERHVRELRLRLALNPTGATGMMGGYEPLDRWWDVQSKSPYPEIGKYSAAGLYKAAHKYADGFPDPKTGQCTAISAAYDVSFVRANIFRGGAKPAQAVAFRN